MTEPTTPTGKPITAQYAMALALQYQDHQMREWWGEWDDYMEDGQAVLDALPADWVLVPRALCDELAEALTDRENTGPDGTCPACWASPHKDDCGMGRALARYDKEQA